MQQKIVKVCTGRSCTERHSNYILTRLQADREFYHFPEELTIESCLCQGKCKEGPTVVYDNDVQVGQNPVKSSELLRKKVNEWKNRK
ncbi:NAD(P)H-dependent oxidoreductase subunit E [Candidatus Gracilibacteria bacterium]|nr:NAD(P)H-dependent oxidoreductase subunit E [Candidatus Gracilibacteria bacterium]